MKNVLSIVASKSGTGKTTLIEKIIKILKGKNYKIGVLKHDAHKFEIDKEGKDSYRFAKAGADSVIISSPEKLAMIEVVKEEKNIEQIIDLFHDVDIILIEGFKKNNFPKIEVHRKKIDNNLLCENRKFNTSTFTAVVSDEVLQLDIPVFDLNDVNSIADFIENNFIKRG